MVALSVVIETGNILLLNSIQSEIMNLSVKLCWLIWGNFEELQKKKYETLWKKKNGDKL